MTSETNSPLSEALGHNSSADERLPGSARPLTPQARVLSDQMLNLDWNSQEVRYEIVKLFAQGFTIRRIIKEIIALTGSIPTERQLVDFYNLYADDIDKCREEAAERVMRIGIARKETRLAFLADLGEQWADRAMQDPKAANVYLKTLEQARRETDQLAIPVHTPDDPWLVIVLQLQEKSGGRMNEVETLQPKEEIIDIPSTPAQTKIKSMSSFPNTESRDSQNNSET